MQFNLLISTKIYYRSITVDLKGKMLTLFLAQRTEDPSEL